MKCILAFCLVWMLLFGSNCFAAEFDLENMTSAELINLKAIIDDEMDANHEPNGSQKSAVDDEVKGFIASYYGEDNVSWAWIDYTYSREWDFFTIETHADIKKQDGGKAQYDIYGEVVANGNNYQVVYVMVGTEVLLDERSTTIKDPRVLSMLGLEAENPEDATVECANEEQAELAVEAGKEIVIIAKRGDKNETVKSIQQMLVQLGYLSGNADGDFGPGTEKAVLAFQKDNVLTEDGIVTQEVYDAIDSAAAALPVPVEYPHFTAVELYKKFEENKLAAEAELEGIEIQVTGTIGDISETIFGTPYVSLNADNYGLSSIQCFFSKDLVSKLTTLKTGKKITIQGTCGTMSLLSIEVTDCKLIP